MKILIAKHCLRLIFSKKHTFILNNIKFRMVKEERKLLRERHVFEIKYTSLRGGGVDVVVF